MKFYRISMQFAIAFSVVIIVAGLFYMIEQFIIAVISRFM